jgi:uncharacterized membrane protein YciS (DUF1049 family)
MYVQIPATGFYFVLGMICGIILTIWFFYTIAKKNEKKQEERMKDLIGNISQLTTETKDKDDK